MKTNQNTTYAYFRTVITAIAITSTCVLTSCDDDDDPVKEDTPELITKATLTFTPEGEGSVVTATASDPDGEGFQDIEVSGSIDLAANTTYTLTIDLVNDLAEPGTEGYSITEEVEEEGDEHMFFFSWTNNVFSDPAGDGNIDSRADQVNYEDEDAGGLPIGLATSWTTATASEGKFRIVLKHQPELKSASSTAEAGETDLDLEFDINIQ